MIARAACDGQFAEKAYRPRYRGALGYYMERIA